MKRFLIPLILTVLALAMLIGSAQSRAPKASLLGRTVFFPFTHSLNIIESNQVLKTEIAKLRVQLAEHTLRNLALQNELKKYMSSTAVSFETGGLEFEI
ncbi:MAG: rod shape-determining protein MreC, partial [Candidatus Cloacimonadaceae bacterium]|nr:rod shape-determining protein MreC [Candidatus Cloacimonadaceae bacterium]